MEDYRNEQGQTLPEFLAGYNENMFRRPSVTADIAVFTAGQDGLPRVLLIRRKNHPYIQQWALPGGFLEMDEELHMAAARELFEETGIEHLPLRQYQTFGGVHRDPRTRVITVGHLAVVPMDALRFQAGDDAADAALFTLKLTGREQSDGRVLSLQLDGPARLGAQALLTQDGLGRKLLPLPSANPYDQNCLAADHDYVLLSALFALLSFEPRRVAALLGSGADAFAVRMLEQLGAVFFGALPQTPPGA